MAEDDASFLSLSFKTRSRIDNAFFKALPSDQQHSNTLAKPSTSANDPPMAGGFLLDDDQAMGGGFLPPSPPAAIDEVEPDGDEQATHIPLSCIPYALQLLDLPPDDEEILAVLRNAATGWGGDSSSRRRGATTRDDGDDAAEGRVSLRDWRAVCAALMDVSGDEDTGEGSGADVNDSDEAAEASDRELLELEESSAGSSDEYTEAAKPQKRTRKSSASMSKPKTRPKFSPRESPSPIDSSEITSRQKQECLRAFLLFFPGVPEEVAKRRRIGVRELNTAVTALKEKIKAEEMTEMLDTFSTSPDKSMSLSDFEKMMIATRLA
ncbi:hypothetical protein BC834DRAFT_956533 [Gloeopeniophorella convolvens]|nr:hypothetical protein BC834DRAFT_956533 [Gloeopeniophorella convolvens]